MSSNLRQQTSVTSSSHQTSSDNMANLKLGDFHVDESDITLELALKILELGDFEDRWSIAKVLVKYGEVIIPPLKEVVLNESANSEHRWYALKILSQLGNQEIILIVSQLLETTEDEDLIILGTEILGYHGRESIDLLSNLLENSEYRLLATKALAQIPNAQVIPPLLSVVKDDDKEIRFTAISALSNFEKPEIMEILTYALQDHVSLIRKAALNGLGLRGKSYPEIDTVKLISPLLYDIDLVVSQQAALSLSRLKNDKATLELFKVLQSPHTPVPLQISLIRALGWIKSPLSIDCLGKSLSLVSYPSAIEIIRIFGRMSDYSPLSELVTILLDFYHGDSPFLQETEVLQALCYSWKQLKAVEAIKEIELMTNHSDDRLRFHAQSALDQLR